MPSTLNVALLGYGLAGRVFHAPLISTTPGLHLHTVVSSQVDAVHADFPQAQVVSQPEDAFANPQIDLVVVATPNDTHAPLAINALQAGKHVVVDKPFALDLEQAQAMISAATRAQRHLSVFHNRRWDADFLSLRELIENNTLGDLAEVHSHFDRFRPQVPDRWRDRQGPGAGLWYDLGPHLADQALHLFGAPLAVSADLAMQRNGATATDYFHVQLRYQRLRVHLHAGSLVAAPGPRFVVHGSAGSWTKFGLDPQEQALREGGVPGSADWGLDPQPGTLLLARADSPEAVAGPHRNGDYPAYYAGMRDAIGGSGPVPVSATDAAQVIHLIQLGIASAQHGRELQFSP